MRKSATETATHIHSLCVWEGNKYYLHIRPNTDLFSSLHPDIWRLCVYHYFPEDDQFNQRLTRDKK
jgi:hypothetical protein